MNTTTLCVLVLFISPLCWGQGQYRIPLEKATFSLSVPSMAAGNGVLYVAYRSFTLLRRSTKLQVMAYDLKSQRELRHTTILVPEVHGPRTADGLYLSPDGQVLAYAELHDPCLLLLISMKDLSGIRRSTSLPFAHQDQELDSTYDRELFGGFDNHGYLSFAFQRAGGTRFVRVDPANLKAVSNIFTAKIQQAQDERLIWSPWIGRAWTIKSHVLMRGWAEFAENGVATGEEFWGAEEPPRGAVVLGEGGLIAFYGIWDHGTAVSYQHHERHVLKLPCLLYQYGISNDPGYAGALCIVQQDQPHGWDKTLSSEFLLLKTDGPSVVWRRKKMDLVDLAEKGRGYRYYYQKGNPLIYRSGKNIYVVAVSKSPELTVYVVPLSE